MPVEASLGDRQRARQAFNVHRRGSALTQGLTGGANPIVTSQCTSVHTLAYGTYTISAPASIRMRMVLRTHFTPVARQNAGDLEAIDFEHPGVPHSAA